MWSRFFLGLADRSRGSSRLVSLGLRNRRSPVRLPSVRVPPRLEPSTGFEIDRVIASPAVTHVRYRVVR